MKQHRIIFFLPHAKLTLAAWRLVVVVEVAWRWLCVIADVDILVTFLETFFIGRRFDWFSFINRSYRGDGDRAQQREQSIVEIWAQQRSSFRIYTISQGSFFIYRIFDLDFVWLIWFDRYICGGENEKKNHIFSENNLTYKELN